MANLLQSLLAVGLALQAVPALAGPTHAVLPAASVERYEDQRGRQHVFLMQAPSPSQINSNSVIFLYIHGAGGLEEQGMNIFPKLRRLLSRMESIYVCPRDYEYDCLLAELHGRFGDRPVYLCGASAGGRSALAEAVRRPEDYSGLVLLGPAVLPDSDLLASVTRLPFPVYMRCGEQDIAYARTCNAIQRRLTKSGGRVFYEIIPGGDHDSPCRNVDWADVMRFLTGRQRLAPASPDPPLPAAMSP